MKVHHADPLLAGELLGELNAQGLHYGESGTYTSLLTVSSTLFSEDEVNAVQGDLDVFWKFLGTWTSLYLQSLGGYQPEWIGRLCEFGLTSAEVVTQRQVAHSSLRPSMARLDYIRMGKDRKIAEVQWKSGGPGLFYGIAGVFSRVIPIIDNAKPIGDLTEDYARSLKDYIAGRDGVVVNEARKEWLPGEKHLSVKLKSLGVRYQPIDRARFLNLIHCEAGKLSVSSISGDYPVAYLRGRAYTEQCDPDLLKAIAKLSLERRIWVEAPLSWIFRQKWGYALPFMQPYRESFNERLRSVLPATALISRGTLDLTPLATYMEHPERSRLSEVRNLSDLVDLPGSLRRSLVLKFGGGVGNQQTRGVGVHRLTAEHVNENETPFYGN